MNYKTIREAAELLEIPRSAIESGIKRGVVEVLRIGRSRRLVDLDEIQGIIPQLVQPMGELCTVKDLTNETGLSRGTILGMIYRGELPVARQGTQGRGYLLRREDALAAIRAMTAPEPGPGSEGKTTKEGRD
jgi:excisionase family DNA binding protein